jgi:hypothetical protein
VSRETRDGRRRRNEEGDRAANRRWFHNGERGLAGDECNDAGDKPNDEGADDAGAVVECGERSSDAREKRRRVDGEREQQQQRKPTPKRLRTNPTMIMAVLSVR